MKFEAFEVPNLFFLIQSKPEALATFTCKQI